MYFNRIIHKPVYSILSIALGLLPIFSKAQLTTSTAMTPAQLVQNVLLGSGIVATNITYTGDIQARGTFNGAASNVGLAAGVILSTGNITNAIGPNNDGGFGNYTDFSLPGDPDLDQIMNPTDSYDATILEFDFIPTSDTIKFRYVFGSEEYMEYVSTTPGGINDGFGFFISGPGITGPYSNNSKNIAIIPGTSLPVTMFNLNLNNNGQYYFDNENPPGASVQYDGFTVPLTAITSVQCGSTYHIKIAIADGSDGIIDSGVFLEEGSFSSTGNVFITTNTDFGGNPGTNDTMFYEGCGAATITFDRGTTHLAFADTMNYIIDGTAGNGIDYSMITTEVIFAIGQQTATVVINSLSDLLAEGTETVILKVFNTSPCGNVNDTSTVTVYIVDSPPISVTLNNDTTLFCPSLNVPLTANATGGVAVGNYTYTWTNATSTSSTANVNPAVTTTYYVTVSDSCGNTASDSMIVNVIPYLPLQLSFNNDTVVCGGNEVLLDANVTQGRPDYVYNWSPNITSVDSITVTPGADITYTLTVTDACGLSVTDQVTVTVYPINADFVYNFTTNQTVDFTNLSTGGATYFWNFGDGSFDSVSTSENPQHYYPTDGTYIVTLISTNQEGCSDTTQQTLVVLPDFYFYFPNAFTPNNNGKNDTYMGYGVGIKSYHMRIFDRWGELIFETTDLYTGWDGTYKGNKLPGGVYPVVFDLEGYMVNPTQKFGHVTLIR
ncbi:MAG: choice-of-anchor L domain-containing protein [Bacteroidia bacterium]|nr:choice-of-anchor L domain-containing protein [Bacteroidia bacterium]